MKNAFEILQYSGAPLEPLVALEVKKTFEARLKEKKAVVSPFVKLKVTDLALQQQQWDLSWYNNYE